ncbi:MAG TPA: aldehyde dehydrogenase family protein [Acidimicrobiia bacterium]|nr:aldehyde dehydrogenase family protein [Acidimicrobiia bacterium]
MTDLQRTQLFIDGQWVDAEGGETFPSVAPSTGEQIADVAKASRADAAKAIAAARRAFDEGPWPRMTGAERAGYLRRVAEIIGERTQEISEIEARDGGGTIKKAMFADVPGGASSFNFFADCAENEPDEIEHGESPFPPAKSVIRREPIGVCTGIVPWNFPFIMASWKIAPAIAAGNCVVLKPASFTSLSAIEMVKACQEAGIPDGVVNFVSGPGGAAGEELAQHPLVDKVAFTGSTEVGRRIMQLASGTVKKVTLELGGKSANIVLDDADLDLAAAGVLWGTFFHNGQVCESGTRALVHADIYDEFVGMLVERAGKIAIGDNMDMATDLGPLVAPVQVDTVERYVKLGLDEGAKLLCGGAKPDNLPDGLDRNAFYQPTIFEADNSMKIAQEEIFGPVLCVIKVHSDDEAIKVANDSIYGLGGGVWSTNVERAHTIASAMRTGTVWVNDYHMISPSQPFGGYKQSGIGRELSEFGFNEYRQIKHIWRNTATDRNGYLHFSALSGNI